MKIILIFLFSLTLAVICPANNFTPMHSAKPEPCKLLPESDAEKIIGQPVGLIENTSEVGNGIRKTNCTYRGVSKDAVSGREINLYFSLDEKDNGRNVKQAQQEFDSAYNAINEPEMLVQRVSEIGDDAFVISNPPHFQFIMVRKGAVILRMKLNKAPGTNSPEELKTFAKKFVEKF